MTRPPLPAPARFPAAARQCIIEAFPHPHAPMDVSRQNLDEAARAGLLQPGQVAPLWDFLAERASATPSFRAAHVLYYVGGLIAIGAMTLFVTLAWQALGGGGLLAVALIYIVIAAVAAEALLRRQLPVPAGILAALAVALVPLAIHAAQLLFGLWPEEGAPKGGYRAYHTHIDWRWLLMELGTLVAGAVALWRWRLPFLVMPVAVTLWYIGMDLAPLIAGGNDALTWTVRRQVAIGFGLGMLVLALAVDVRSRRGPDFAFWLYLFGVVSFWGGLTALDAKGELGRLAYAGINVLMIAIGTALSRRVFAVFGGIGLALYLGDLSYRVFKDSIAFPFVLTALGLAVVALGIVWQRNERRIGAALRARLPPALRETIERR